MQKIPGDFQESLATNSVSVTANLDEKTLKHPKTTQQKKPAKKPLQAFDNTNNKICPLLNSNTTHICFLAPKR